MKTLDITRNYCNKLGWRYKDAGEFIVIGFDVDGRLEPIYIKQKEKTAQNVPCIEVSYFGGDISDYEEKSIHPFLLERNAKLPCGKWIIRKIASDDICEFRYINESAELTNEKFIEMVGICIGEIQQIFTIKK